MRTVMKIAVVTGLLAGISGICSARQPSHPAGQPHRARSYRREVPRQLLAQARISEDSALRIAMARLPGAKVQALELENENGHLIWSWEMKLEGKTGIEEVNVNALDGSVARVEHENPSVGRHDTTKAARRPRP